MFGKLKGRRGPSEKSKGRDKAIIHQTVPEEVFADDRAMVPSSDMSWLDQAPAKKPNGETSSPALAKEPPKRPAPAARPKAPAKPPQDTLILTPQPAPSPTGDANAAAAHRPKFPCGWLVVVEGPGVGEWFVLEHGVSHIGRSQGQTVQVDFGDASIAGEKHAILSYDDARHTFVVHGGDGSVRVNGIPLKGGSDLRDGDVIAIGSTGLRLVSLCSRNFNWNEARRVG